MACLIECPVKDCIFDPSVFEGGLLILLEKTLGLEAGPVLIILDDHSLLIVALGNQELLGGL